MNSEVKVAGAHVAHHGAGLSNIDYVVVGGYITLVILVAVGASVWNRLKQSWWPQHAALLKENESGTRRSHDVAEDFFLSNRSASFWIVAASYFASNIGTDAIVGLSSAGASVGLAASAFDIASALAFLALAYVFLPVYRASGVYTLPEWAELRFGRTLRLYLATASLLLYALAKISVALYCGTLVLTTVTGASSWAAIGALLGLTALLSAAGGLRAVLAIEACNTVLLLVGGSAAAGVSVTAAGGVVGLLRAITSGSPDALAAGMTPRMAHLAQPSKAPYALPALLVGAPWLILWFHAGDQEMVQRGLAGASDGHARLGSVLAGWLKLTVPWTWAVPGLAARILFPKELGCPSIPHSGVEPGAPTECTQPNLAYPVLLTRLLPPGLAGAVLAACLAGVVSVLASTLNSASTLATMDLVRTAAGALAEQNEEQVQQHQSSQSSSRPMAQLRACCTGSRRLSRCSCHMPYRPRLSHWLLLPSTLVWVGRAVILLLVAASVAWLPVLPRLAPSLYTAMQSLNAYVAPPVAVVFTAGLLWPGATGSGALACLIVGHTLGAARLILELSGVGVPSSASGGSPSTAAAAVYAVLARPDFLYFAAASGVLSTCTLVLVSCRTRSERLSLARVGPLSAPAALRVACACALLQARMLRALHACMVVNEWAAHAQHRAEEYRTVSAALDTRAKLCRNCGAGRRLRVEVQLEGETRVHTHANTLLHENVHMLQSEQSGVRPYHPVYGREDLDLEGDGPPSNTSDSAIGGGIAMEDDGQGEGGSAVSVQIPVAGQSRGCARDDDGATTTVGPDQQDRTRSSHHIALSLSTSHAPLLSSTTQSGSLMADDSLPVNLSHDNADECQCGANEAVVANEKRMDKASDVAAVGLLVTVVGIVVAIW